MSGGKEATSEQSSSVRECESYDEVYPSGCGPEEGLSWSLEREPSAQSPNEGEEEGYEGGEGENDEREDREEKEGKEEEESDEGSHEKSDRLTDQSEGKGSRPFILPKIWTVNDYYPTMSQKVFHTLRDRHQIPDNIPIRLLEKFERCYSGKAADVGMYDAMFIGGLGCH